MQEYFLVACSLADLIRRFRSQNNDWSLLAQKAAIQLNDTHPSFAVAELMRILLDDARLGWEAAWTLTCATLGYTNHTLLPEALEKWPVEWFELLIPRQLEIIYEINRRLLEAVRAKFPGDESRVQRMSLIEEGPVQHVRMAHLAIVGSDSTNGVAEIHSELLRTITVRDFAELFPERFNNKTNGVTPRRWLLLANPPLAALITQAIGDEWISDLGQLRRLKSLADDAVFLDRFMAVKRESKSLCIAWLNKKFDLSLAPDAIFDCHIKRIHEYKRQLLNVLRIIVLYNRLRENPHLDWSPGPSSLPARRRRHTGSPSSSSNSSKTSGWRSRRTRGEPFAARACSSRTTMFRWRSGSFRRARCRIRFPPPATRPAAPAI